MDINHERAKVLSAKIDTILRNTSNIVLDNHTSREIFFELREALETSYAEGYDAACEDVKTPGPADAHYPRI